jgi:translation initiation factor eIF-2B subunit alpha/methylthioribose-1-phosphate isomerase
MRIKIDGEYREMQAVWFEDGVVKLIDQRKLPAEFEIFEARNTEKVAYAIKEMVVRGAPAIGITAAYGMAQAWMNGWDIEKTFNILKNTRPTAHDLFYALNTMKGAIENGEDAVKRAEEYAKDIIGRCENIGEHGEKLIKDGYRILTHCNAGALAVGDWGTATAPIRKAHRNGKRIFVWVDETRPRLQGARLTAWEMVQEGIEHAVIADNAAGYFMRKGEVDMVIVGADRIAKNGDVANKIGTYEKAVVAYENGIPFYVAAPISTFDFSLDTGDEIPIEERREEEVLFCRECRIAPAESRARNPAFDVTPAKYITGIITERGIFKPEEIEKIFK